MFTIPLSPLVRFPGAIIGKAAISSFYYQRIFGALCGMTVGEYIRARRMTLAAQELAGSDVK